MPDKKPSYTVIKPGNLVDGQGGPPQQGMAVVVEDGRIARVVRESELAFPEGASPEVLDFPGATLMPGLVDCHTHTNMPGDGTSVDGVGLEDDGIHLLTGVKQARLALDCVAGHLWSARPRRGPRLARAKKKQILGQRGFAGIGMRDDRKCAALIEPGRHIQLI